MTEKITTVQDLNVGDVFSINNYPQSPKLRIKDGFVEIQTGLIKTDCKECMEKEATLLSVQDIATAIMEPAEDVQVIIDKAKAKYL